MHNLSIRTGNALDNDQLRRAAPSIFTLAPAGKVTDRYSFMPTHEVIAGLRANGFMPYAARQTGARLEGGNAFARHEVRFRHADTIARLASTHTPGIHNFLAVPEEFDEIVLLNSHDGSSTFELMHGVYRLVCSNGLIVEAQGRERVSIRHSGDVVSNVIEGATRIVEDAAFALELRNDMRGIVLEQDEQVAFAQAALELRYDGESPPIVPAALLQRRREEDKAGDLWTILNVVQENMVKGGLRGHTANTGRRMTTRGISGITQDIAVNRMLWNLAEAARNMHSTLDLAARTAAEVA